MALQPQNKWLQSDFDLDDPVKSKQQYNKTFPNSQVLDYFVLRLLFHIQITAIR